jgi:hypothetical protein
VEAFFHVFLCVKKIQQKYAKREDISLELVCTFSLFQINLEVYTMVRATY